MSDKCNDLKECEYKTERNKCRLLSNTDVYVKKQCPFCTSWVPEPVKIKKTGKVYKRERFCRLFCKYYIPGVEWNATREPKGKCVCCPLTNGYKID